MSPVATLSSSSQLDLNHITVFDNASAGLLISAGTLSISNSVIGQSNDGPDCSNNGTINQNSANHISDGSCAAAFSGDTQLGALTDNGGATLTHRPADASPLVDAADLASCAATDQRGLPRPFNAGCDIGAVEIIPDLVFSDGFEQ